MTKRMSHQRVDNEVLNQQFHTYLETTPRKFTLHTVAQTFVCFQVALVEAVKKGKRNRVETAIVKRKSKVTSCAMLFFA